MAAILVDSDVLIEHLRGREPTATDFRRLFEQDHWVFYSPVAKAEIYAGVPEGEELVTANLFRIMRCVTIDDAVGEKAGHYLRWFHASHGLQLGDGLQAACASVFELQLWTLNRKHYPMDDIRFYEPG